VRAAAATDYRDADGKDTAVSLMRAVAGWFPGRLFTANGDIMRLPGMPRRFLGRQTNPTGLAGAGA